MAKRRRINWKRWIRWSVLIIFLGFTPTFAIIIWRTWLISDPDVTPSPFPRRLVVEEQVEPHTCGLHSLRSLYRAYGIDPSSEKLRAGSGADFWNRSSTGTFHADIYMSLPRTTSE